MDNIYSEKELFPSGSAWGHWNFSLTEDQIDEKLSSLSDIKTNEPLEENHIWSTLFSVLQKAPAGKESDSKPCLTLPLDESAMEYLPIEEENEEKIVEDIILANKVIEDIIAFLVDSCNQAASKPRLGLSGVLEEMTSITSDLEKVHQESIESLMKSAWSQLHSDASRMCFCIPFCSRSPTCHVLCSTILLPWLSTSLPNKLEQLSEILASNGEMACIQLIAPLLCIQDSPFVKDLLNLEDLMTSMTGKHWTTLLREILSKLGEIEAWCIPSLTTVVEHSSPSGDDVCLLVQLMSSTGTTFSQSRDFGALLVAVASCLKSESVYLVSQIKSIANNYKGPLKFKVLKILADSKD